MKIMAAWLVNRSLPIGIKVGTPEGLFAYYPPKPRPLCHATIASLALLLAACQTSATRTQTVEVRVPVAVQPIKPEQVPAVPAPLGPRPQSASAAADMLLADHCKWVAYGLLTDPLLRLSAGEPPKMLPKYPECER